VSTKDSILESTKDSILKIFLEKILFYHAGHISHGGPTASLVGNTLLQ